MKYIYGLQKSGISLANYLYSIGEDFYAWDDNKNVRNLFLLKSNDIKLKKHKDYFLLGAFFLFVFRSLTDNLWLVNKTNYDFYFLIHFFSNMLSSILKYKS